MVLNGKYNDRLRGTEQPNKVYHVNSISENGEIVVRQSIAKAGFVTVPSVGLMFAGALVLGVPFHFVSELVEWLTFQEMPRLQEAIRFLAGR